MAQLKDSIVAGSLRVTDKVLANGVQTNVINAPTASGGTTYGPGTNGQVLKSNGTTVYWTSDNNSDTKNTAGTTNKTGAKMFIVAATEQSTNPVTYSNSNVYIGTDNCLYSGGTKVLTAHQDISGKVTGPSSATNNAVAIFDGTGGKTIKNSGFTIGASVPSGALFTDTTYESKAAASGGTAVSLVTTGEKYTWNNKSTLAIGTTASTAMAGNTTVTNVAISANTTTNANYPVVFATSNKDTTAAKNEGVQKSGAKFYFNPSTGNVVSTKFNGLTLTSATTGFTIAGGTTSKTLTVGADYTLGAACAKGVTDNSSSKAVTSSDTNLITGRTLYYAGYTKNAGTVTSITLKAGAGISLDTDNTAITTSGTRTIGHSNSVTAATAGTSSATNGVTLDVPYVTYDAQGHITASGTHTHTVPVMTGAYSTNGKSGLVPAPTPIPRTYLRYDGLWVQSEATSIFTVAAGSWTSATPPTQTINNIANVKAVNVDVMVSPARTITVEQLDALAAAKIICTGQGEGTITLTCYGTEPTVDIPLAVTVFH